MQQFSTRPVQLKHFKPIGNLWNSITCYLISLVSFSVLINKERLIMGNMLGSLVQPLPKSDHVVSFTDADELLRDSELVSTERDEVLEAELAQNDR